MLDPDRAFSDELVGDRQEALLRPGPVALGLRVGLQVFFNYGCAGCHIGVGLGGTVSARFGIVWEATREFVTIDAPIMLMDVGRFAVTNDTADLYVFKNPSLRSITRTYPCFHDSSVWDLRAATQVMARAQLGRNLCEPELDAKKAWYGTLEGQIPAQALHLPALPASSTTTTRPDHR